MRKIILSLIFVMFISLGFVLAECSGEDEICVNLTTEAKCLEQNCTWTVEPDCVNTLTLLASLSVVKLPASMYGTAAIACAITTTCVPRGIASTNVIVCAPPSSV